MGRFWATSYHLCHTSLPIKQTTFISFNFEMEGGLNLSLLQMKSRNSTFERFWAAAACCWTDGDPSCVFCKVHFNKETSLLCSSILERIFLQRGLRFRCGPNGLWKDYKTSVTESFRSVKDFYSGTVVGTYMHYAQTGWA